MRNNFGNKTIQIVFILVFLTILVFNFLTPLVSDDYIFSFDVSDEGNRVSSFHDIKLGLIRHWNHANGRILPHLFVYLFLMVPKPLFNCINSFICLMLVYEFFSFTKSDNNVKNIILLLTEIFSLWCFSPAFGDTVLWLTGSCNYLWGAVLYLFILFCLYRFICDEQSWGKKPIVYITLIILSFIAGGYSENGACSMIFMVLLIILWLKVSGRKVPLWLVLALAFMTVGFCIMASAPAIKAGRMSERNFSVLAKNIKNCIKTTKEYALIPLLIYAFLLSVAIVKKVNTPQIIFSAVLVAGGLVSVAVFAVAVYIPLRSLHLIILYTLLASSLLIAELWEKDCIQLNASILSIITVLFLFSFTTNGGEIISVGLQSYTRKSLIAEAHKAEVEDIFLPVLMSDSPYTAVTWEELSDSSDEWYNDLLAKYYDFNTVTGVLNEQFK